MGLERCVWRNAYFENIKMIVNEADYWKGKVKFGLMPGGVKSN